MIVTLGSSIGPGGAVTLTQVYAYYLVSHSQNMFVTPSPGLYCDDYVVWGLKCAWDLFHHLRTREG
jgi:hypothetical protein